MKAASLPWQWLRFSLLYPWGHSTCPFSTTGCAGKKANSEGHRQQSHPSASYLLLRPPCRRVCLGQACDDAQGRGRGGHFHISQVVASAAWQVALWWLRSATCASPSIPVPPHLLPGQLGEPSGT